MEMTNNTTDRTARLFRLCNGEETPSDVRVGLPDLDIDEINAMRAYIMITSGKQEATDLELAIMLDYISLVHMWSKITTKRLNREIDEMRQRDETEHKGAKSNR